MKKILLLAALLAVTSTAFAEWHISGDAPGVMYMLWGGETQGYKLVTSDNDSNIEIIGWQVIDNNGLDAIESVSIYDWGWGNGYTLMVKVKAGIGTLWGGRLVIAYRSAKLPVHSIEFNYVTERTFPIGPGDY